MEADSIVIRPLAATDPVPIATAFAAIGWKKPREQYERYLAEQAAGVRDVFVVTVGDEFAGYVTLTWHPTYPTFRDQGIPEVQDLNVLPRFRRRGLGSALLAAAEDVARTRAEAVGIGVGLDPDYGAAQRLYVQRGYVPDGRGITYRGRTVRYGENVVVDDGLVLCFTKRLSAPPADPAAAESESRTTS